MTQSNLTMHNASPRVALRPTDGPSTPGLGRILRRETTIVLYHHFAEGEDALTKHLRLTTKPETFKQHLDYYSKNFDIISGAELIDGVRLPKKSLLITFDDAYSSVLDIAGPLLKSRKAPSVFFVNPATVQGDFLPIDNVLSLASEMLGFARVLRMLDVAKNEVQSVAELIARVVSDMNTSKVREAKRRLCEAIGESEAAVRRASTLFLAGDRLKEAGLIGMEIGNHTSSHSFLRCLDPDELSAEVGNGRAELQRLSGACVQYFSIPYGNQRDATRNVLDVVRSTNHRATFLVHAKSNMFRPAPDTYYRVSVVDSKVDSLPWMLSVAPILRTARDFFRSA
jgi:peptidoglycan/xylan/chitin deacetylase (PgdA/CDA1 family)